MRTKPLQRLAFVIALLIYGGPASLASSLAQAASGATKAQFERRLSLKQTYRALPISFELNQGQTDSRVKFLAHGAGYEVFLTDNGAVLSLNESEQDKPNQKSINRTSRMGSAEVTTAAPAILQIQLKDANLHAEVTGEDRLPGLANYFIGRDPAKWRTGVPTYARVRYVNVYPGIDIVYHGSNEGRLEYDFVLSPGADPSRIQLIFPGALRLTAEHTGDLVVQIGSRELIQPRPAVYQNTEGKRHLLKADYVLRGPQTVGFRVARYDPSKPLVIDPQLIYSSFLGGSSSDFGNAIAVDSFGHAYIAGTTSSIDFPVTSGAFQPSLRGSSDAFIAKLNAEGTGLLFSTYLGGSQPGRGGSAITSASGIALDRTGDAYVAGTTSSSDFPTTPGAFQTTFGPDSSQSTFEEVFTTKLNTDGSALVYSTYLGKGHRNISASIAIDSASGAYVTGSVVGTLPATPGAFQTTFGGFGDAFVIKLNIDGSDVVYATYLGGSNNGSGGRGIAVDAGRNAYVTGFTFASDFPTTSGAFQTAIGGRNIPDAFVTKLSADGSAAIYSTYLGGSDNDSGTAIAVDRRGSAYLTGSTLSSNFPTTRHAPQKSLGDGGDAFVAKLNAAGSALVYSTYLGGSSDDAGLSLALDHSGKAYISGQTLSNNFPVTHNAFQPTLGGESDPFVTELTPDGAALVFSTYLGGSDIEAGNGIALDFRKNIYVAGTTASANFSITNDAFQANFGGSTDAFVAKIGVPARKK